MTAQKHLKARVRARMQKTGESYASARRQMLRQPAAAPRDPAARWHFAGNVPATTALRILLAHSGVRAPHTGEPFSEALLFGLAGGIGIGACSFYYQKENFSSFFLAGKHLWQDDVAYMRGTLQRLGIEPIIRETSGARTALEQLRETVAEGPCIAWVDMVHLPYRAMPPQWSGGGYHVITIYALRDKDALIGDMTDEPIGLALGDLATARSRIRKQKNRLLSIPPSASPADLGELVRQGVRACHRGLTQKPRGMPAFFTLDSLRLWGDRLYGSRDKESWDLIFKPGPNLWRGLTWVHNCIENYGTGGGLCRPLFADFLSEAAEAVSDSRLGSLAERYADLGRRWSDLADAALPDNVPLLAEAKQLQARKAELIASGGPEAGEEMQAVQYRLGEMANLTREQFPLSEEESTALRADLQNRVRAVYEQERAAAAALGEWVA
jgi:hypothetical protein